jgi:hypothetical protein
MNGVSAAELSAGDQLLQELIGPPAPSARAETMGRLKRVRYTHQAMIDLIIEHPEYSQNQLAAEFGFSAGWVSNVLASEAFQAAMAARREEVIDPELKATIKERFDALVRSSLDVLMKKLQQPAVSDQVAIRCAELGAKALGVGGHAAPAAKVESSADRLERLASRLEVLNGKSKGEIIDIQAEVCDPQGSELPLRGGERSLSGPGSGQDVSGHGAGGHQAHRGGAGQDAASDGGV